MRILSAPVYSFYSVEFYRQVLKSPLSKAFLYLAYLTALANIAVLLFFLLRVQPFVRSFVDWTAKEMPELTWTPDGISMNAKNPYVMTHPDYGPLVVFDTTKTDIDAGEMGDAPIFVTRTKVYTRSGPDDVRIYELTRRPADVPKDKMVVQVDSNVVYRLYDAFRPWFVGMAVFLFFPAYFIWKLLEILFFSVVGMLVNLTRKPTLAYGEVLKICFFAVTPAAIFQLASIVIPAVGKIPYGFFLSFVLTTGYIIFAMKKTEDPLAGLMGS